MPTLRFVQNVPQVIALAFSEGKVKPSTLPGRADDIQYTLATPAGMQTYLPLSAAEMIRRAGITARVPFEICKVGKDDYRITTINGGGRASDAPVTESQIQGSNYTNYTSPNHTAPPPPPERIYTAPVPPPAPPAAPPPAAPRAMAPAPPAPVVQRAETICTKALASALIASIDGYLIAAEYAKAKGIVVSLQLDFNAEDIRQSATSLMIECFRREGGR